MKKEKFDGVTLPSLVFKTFFGDQRRNFKEETESFSFFLSRKKRANAVDSLERRDRISGPIA